VPNAALRFRPTDIGEPSEPAAGAPPRAGGAEASQGSATGGGRGGFQGPRQPGSADRSGPRAASEDLGDAEPGVILRTVYLLDAAGGLGPARIRTGLSDGRSTEVLGGELKEGDAVVVGFATARVNTAGGRPPMRGF